MMCIPAFLSLQHCAHCFAFLVSPQCQPAYLHMSSCQAAECTCCDTCIWSRSQCPRRCAGSLHCHGYKSLQGKQHATTNANNQFNIRSPMHLRVLACTYRCSLSGSWPAQSLDGTHRPHPLWMSPCRCGRSRAPYSYS